MQHGPLRWLLLLALVSPLAAAPLLIDNGNPIAEIVISANDHRPRMAALAALELQYYLEKISGARLPIVTEPAAKPVSIYVGQSDHTDRLGIGTEDLRYGAFRIVSGDKWLVLIGQDHDFMPPQPQPRSRADIPRARAAWDGGVGDRTDAAWGYAFAGLHDDRWNPPDYDAIMGARYGADTRHVWDPRDGNASENHTGPGMGSGFFLRDWGGSINAVCEYLRTLGVRWYMPGELGAVVPGQTSIPLPAIDRTVHPDFPLRCWLGTRRRDWDGLLWKHHIGINSAYEILGLGGTHGMGQVLIRNEMKEKHPDYYAWIGGQRLTDQDRGGPGEPCFSSEGLVNESVAYLRFRFEEYDEHMVQFSPPDGLRKCQCDECRAVPTSDLVFGFLDRVARQLAVTHPDHVVLGAAYTSYQAPPEGIARLSPNIAVTLNNCGRPAFMQPEAWGRYWQKVEGWRAKVAPGHLIRTENNRYEAGRPIGFPVIHPRAMARDLRALKGVSLGDRNEISLGPKTLLNAPGLSHLTLYVNARFLWDADQDIDRLLDEYYALFYGPAAGAMKTAFTYAEQNNTRRAGERAGMDYSAGAEFIDRILSARAAVGGDVYGQRIDLILAELVPTPAAEATDGLLRRAEAYVAHLRRRASVLAERKPEASFRWWNLDNGKWDKAREEGALDGILDEPFWRQGKTFGDKASRTRVSILASPREVYVGLRGNVAPGEALNVTATQDDDPAILAGDHIAFLLETDAHSYYQIAINPAGAVFCRDRSEGGNSAGAEWTAQAETAAHVGDGFWSVELRIPLDRAGGDPLHKVLARQLPSATFPWYFNVISVRVKDGDKTVTAFSMPEDGDVYDPAHFAKLYR